MICIEVATQTTFLNLTTVTRDGSKRSMAMTHLDITGASPSFDKAAVKSALIKFQRPFRSFIKAIKRWHECYDRRQRLLYLLSYDDHILDDMGYTRADLQMISRLPITVDAHQLLKDLSSQRRQ